MEVSIKNGRLFGDAKNAFTAAEQFSTQEASNLAFKNLCSS